MSGNAGDAHIWTATTDAVPVAECGYIPPVEDITADNPDPDGDPIVIGQQVVHAAPTGNTCAACIAAVAPTTPDQED